MLLLDEPLGALDLKLRKGLQIELKRIQREVGITFIYVTHDQEEALTMSDRIAVMNRGVIEQLDAPEEVYERPRTEFVAGFIGVSNLMPGQVVSERRREAELRLDSGRRRVRAARRRRCAPASAATSSCARRSSRSAGRRARRAAEPSVEGVVESSRLSRHGDPDGRPARRRRADDGARAEHRRGRAPAAARRRRARAASWAPSTCTSCAQAAATAQANRSRSGTCDAGSSRHDERRVK